MRNGHADDIGRLVEPGRVHRRVYTDPDLFELEMERIFGRAWLFVGHTSQVPQPGDYITTELGRQPVIMARHRDGSVQVLLNRCTHRGAKVVNERKGHAQRLTCCYHGWSFDTDGKLLTVPVPEGCGEGFDKDALGLARAPRVGQYRGFVFASLAQKGQSFEDHIGPMKGNIDDLVDRAPDGELARCRHAPLRLQRQLEAPGRERARLVSRAVRSCLDRQQTGRAVRAPRGRPEGRHRGRGREETDRGVLEGSQELYGRQRPRLDQQHLLGRRQALQPGFRRV
jgi:nitrite reductase/ring-hydroxylating ferredoxin subunit